jgi:hypothetical protein
MKMQDNRKKRFSPENYEFVREVADPPFFSLSQVYLFTNEKLLQNLSLDFQANENKSEIIQSL